MLGGLIMIKFNVLLFKVFIAVMTVVTLISSFTVQAEQSYQEKYEAAKGKQMEVKCHVEYQGGGDDIHFVIGSFSQPSQAMKLLDGRKVGNKNAKMQKTIYKIKECVEGSERFSSKSARQLDKAKLR